MRFERTSDTRCLRSIPNPCATMRIASNHHMHTRALKKNTEPMLYCSFSPPELKSRPFLLNALFRLSSYEPTSVDTSISTETRLSVHAFCFRSLPAILFILVQQILQYASIPQHCKLSCTHRIVVIVGSDLVLPWHGVLFLLALYYSKQKKYVL